MISWIASHPGSTLATVSQELGFPKATAHRILGDCERLGWLRKAPAGRGFTVGSSLTQTAFDVLAARVREAVPRAIMRRLAQDVGETCTIAIPDGDVVRFIENFKPERQLAFVLPVQSHGPLFCTSSGRLLLATMSDENVAEYLRVTELKQYTKHTIVDVDKLRAIIRDVRRKGYAATHHQWELHVVGAAVPVDDAKGNRIAMLSFTAPDARVPFGSVQQLLPKLMAASEELRAALTA